VNYWQRWIGDWKRKTSHLSAEAKGIYGELLDHLYAAETPLPQDLEAVYRIAGAISASERKSVEIVLREFFTMTPTGYTNDRAFEEIAKRSKYVEEQRERAQMRWHKPEHSEGRPKAKGNGEDKFTVPDWLDATQFTRWIKIRPAKARTDDAQAAAVAKLAKFRSEGIDPNAVVAESLANGWQGLFKTDHKRGGTTLARANDDAAQEAARRIMERDDAKD